MSISGFVQWFWLLLWEVWIMFWIGVQTVERKKYFKWNSIFQAERVWDFFCLKETFFVRKSVFVWKIFFCSEKNDFFWKTFFSTFYNKIMFFPLSNMKSSFSSQNFRWKNHISLTDTKMVLGCSQHCTTNRMWIPFDWKWFRWCIKMRRLDVPHGHHGTHDKLGIRFQRLHTFLVWPEHQRNGNWSVELHDKLDNRGQERREFYSNLALSHGVHRDDDDEVECTELVRPDDITIRMSIESNKFQFGHFNWISKDYLNGH